MSENYKFQLISHKLIFMGTPRFAAIILKKIIAIGWIPKAVITQPDKPIGRKQTLEESPVKKLALKHNIVVLQPEKLKNNEEIVQKIKNLNPNLIVVAAYGKIIPKNILGIPKYGCLNIHGSLLPKYRGASPIQYTILNGDEKTGVTIILIDEKMDHGPLIASSELKIKKLKLNYKELSEKLAKLGAELLIKILPNWVKGEIEPVPQNHNKATYTKIIRKKDGLIDWNKSAKKIEQKIRAFQSWPTAFTKVPVKRKQKILKIFKAEVCKEQRKPGEIFWLNKKMAVGCGQNALILEEVQLEGKKRMSATDFLRGHSQFIGAVIK